MINGKIYLVQANYDDYESSWSKIIGIFDSIDVAEKHKQKWDNFYNINKSIFDEPKNWKPNLTDGDEDDDEWMESREYWSLKSKYDDIFQFNSVSIDELSTNIDLFLDNEFITDAMKELLIQYNRDYKIKEIL